MLFFKKHNKKSSFYILCNVSWVKHQLCGNYANVTWYNVRNLCLHYFTPRLKMCVQNMFPFIFISFMLMVSGWPICTCNSHGLIVQLEPASEVYVFKDFFYKKIIEVRKYIFCIRVGIFICEISVYMYMCLWMLCFIWLEIGNILYLELVVDGKTQLSERDKQRFTVM